MTDPSQLTDAQLLAIIGGQPQPAAPRPAQPRAQSGVSRGERNANQGNIKDGPFARRQPGYAGSDGTFARFSTPEAGNAAQVALLANNYIGAGFDTPTAIVNRYAPPGPENSPASVANYTNYVASSLGIGPNDRVSPQQAEALAQAMREFETGNTRPMGAQPVASDLTQIGDEELLAIANGVDPLALHQPENIDVNALINTQNDFGAPVSQYTQESPFVALDEATMTPEQVAEYRRAAAGIRKGDYIRLPDGSIQRASSDAYAEENPDRAGSVSQGGGLYTRAPNIADRISAFGTAAGEQLPFLDEAAIGTSALLQGRGYSEVADDYRQMQGLQNQSYRGERVAGGITGAATGLLAPGSGFVRGGATVANRALRASALGAGYGSVYGAGAAEGGIDERLRAGAEGAAIGGLTGGLLQSGGERLARNRAAPSRARLLSREGVDLTPGQMMSEVPIIGPMARSLEEGASSIPFIGQPIAQARQQSVETFNRAAINRALAPIDERLPRGMRAGYEAVEEAQGRLGRAYDEVLPRVSARVDDQFDLDLSAISDRAQSELTPPMAEQFDNIVRQRLFRNIPENETISGADFKRIESEIGALSREYRTAQDPQNRALARVLDDTQEVVRDLIARQNPSEAARIRAINRGYANLVRVEDAAASTASQGSEGVFSPTQLGMASRRGATRSQAAREGALMQDLAVSGRNIIPSRVGDSGTATRGALTGLIAGLASGVPVAGTMAAPVIASSVIYSRPVQSALNAVYRASDSRAANEGLQTLLEAARRDPAMVPVYQSALDHLRGEGGQSPSQAPRSDVLSQAQAGMPVP